MGSSTTTNKKENSSTTTSTSVKNKSYEFSEKIAAVNEPQEKKSNSDAISIELSYSSLKKHIIDLEI